MSDEKKPPVGQCDFSHLFPVKDPDAAPPRDARKKRRRKGYLNDGQWAPGYGPDAKKPK